MKKIAYSALVLGGHAITSLGICRNLGINGIPVFCVNNNLNETAFSKFCRKFFTVSDIELNESVLGSFLDRFHEQTAGQVVLFPASDRLCLTLARMATRIDKDKYIYPSNRSSVETLVDKKSFAHSLDKTRIPHPLTHYLDDSGDNKKTLKDVTLPVLIKPALTQYFTKFNVKSLVAKRPEELEESIELILKEKIPVILQEIVPGPPSNLFGLAGYVDKNSEIKGIFAYRRIRDWPSDFGCNSLIKSIPVNTVSDSKDALVDYLKSIRYCGLFEAEFKIDERTNIPKLLEINARSWWQNQFPTICGLNLLLMAFMDAVGKNVEYNDTYQTGIKWVHPVNDLLAAVNLLEKNKLSLSSWLSSYRNVKSQSYFSAQDLLPYLFNPFFEGPAYAKDLLRKLKILE